MEASCGLLGLARCLLRAQTRCYRVMDPSQLCRPFSILGARAVPGLRSSASTKGSLSPRHGPLAVWGIFSKGAGSQTYPRG